MTPEGLKGFIENNSIVQVGDVIRDRGGRTMRVESFGWAEGVYKTPYVYYEGILVKKNGQERKNKEEWVIWPHDLKEIVEV